MNFFKSLSINLIFYFPFFTKMTIILGKIVSSTLCFMFQCIWLSCLYRDTRWWMWSKSRRWNYSSHTAQCHRSRVSATISITTWRNETGMISLQNLFCRSYRYVRPTLMFCDVMVGGGIDSKTVEGVKTRNQKKSERKIKYNTRYTLI